MLQGLEELSRDELLALLEITAKDLIALDERILCECISCYPDATDDSCTCAWRFSI